MKVILAPYGVPAEGFAQLEKEYRVCIPPVGETFSPEEMESLLPQAVALVATRPITAEMMAQAPCLKVVMAYGAGFDNIDLKAATARGIPVGNVPDTVTAATAEIAIGLMLATMRRIAELNERLHREKPESLIRMGLNMGTSLEGATLGIIGMGRIGKRTADIAMALGMKILYTSHSPKAERDQLGNRFVSLEELLRESDVVSLHCPSNEETFHLMNTQRLAMMKPTAFLINTGRGKLVEDDALIEALRNRKIAGAGLDVFHDEPHMDARYQELDNAVLLPHVGSNTPQTRFKMAQAISRNILQVLSGGKPENWVNPF